MTVARTGKTERPLKAQGKALCYRWLMPVMLTLFLFISYAITETRYSPESNPFLKGLHALEHFAIHYAVGVFFALVILTLYFTRTRRRAPEPLILFCSIFLSHWPDIRFFLRGGNHGHDAWEWVFLLHTLVDESRWSFAIFSVFDIALGIYYWRRIGGENL